MTKADCHTDGINDLETRFHNSIFETEIDRGGVLDTLDLIIF